MRSVLNLMLACGALLAVSVAPAQALIIGGPGDPGNGNCIPFGCASPATSWGTEYQQVYAATDFSGPITITDLRFYDNNFNNGGTPLDGGTFTISLSTTSKVVNGLDTTLANNLGADNTVVFSGTLPASVAFGSFFDIFVTPFSYNPAGGNLLLDVQSANATNTFFTVLDARNGDFGSLSSRATNGAQCGLQPPACNGWGLVTGFNESSAAVPEPLTLSLFGAGFAGAAALRRRKAKSA